MSDGWNEGNWGPPLFPRVRLARRELLRRGVMAATALLSTDTSSLQAQQVGSKGRRIIVIGAGFAGLACGYELASIGYEVTILEARPRVGGRVLSLNDFVAGKIVEAGGELLGSNHPNVLAYAAKFGFEFLGTSDDHDPSPLILDGQSRVGDEVTELRQECQSAYRLMTDDARAVNADEPWKTPDAGKLDRTSTAEWMERQKFSAAAKLLLTLQLTSNNGVVTSQQSYLGNLTQIKGGGLERYWSDTEVYRLKGGNQQLATRFAKELGDGRVHLGRPVRGITTTEAGVTVIDAQGKRYEADDVVLAIPPSTWKTIRFTPGLPPELAPQMGVNVKYLAALKSPFWQSVPVSPSGQSDGVISTTWHGTAGQMSDERTAESEVVMVAFTGGPAADRLSRLAAAEIDPVYLEAFERLFPGFTKHFQKGQMMNWVRDPWTEGGYSFPSPGQITAIGPLLRQGIGRLHFAGEHCCYQFIGYIEGALFSGATLARRLAQRDGIHCAK